MPSQTFRHAAVSEAAPDAAWKALQQASTWEAIAGVDQVTDPATDAHGVLRSYRFSVVAGGRCYPGVARTVEASAPQRMVVEIDTTEMGGRIEVEISPHDGGSRVEVGLTVSSKGLFTGMLFPLVAAAIGEGFPSSVEEFTRRL